MLMLILATDENTYIYILSDIKCEDKKARLPSEAPYQHNNTHDSMPLALHISSLIQSSFPSFFTL